MKLKGITKGDCFTLGSKTIEITTLGYTFRQDFHFVNSNFQIPTHGILGRDFLLQHKAIIDYNELKLLLESSNGVIEIPINLNKINNQDIFHLSLDNNTRGKALLKVLNNEHVNIISTKSIECCIRYADVFNLPGDKLSVNNFYKQSIKILDDTPVYIKNYRIAHSHLLEIEKQIKVLINDGIIEKSTSPYNAPLLVVPKKDDDGNKNFRMVVDYRQLNLKIVDDKFPITRLEDVLDKLYGAKFFSTLDLSSSFHQIELEEESRPLTAFTCSNGHYQFKRLPFGLKISTNSFQRMITLALSGLENIAFPYVDDIIIFGSTIAEHNANLKTIFERLRLYNIKLNPKKCKILKTEIIYLGHLITSEGVKTDSNKYKAIEKYPCPKDSTEVKRFVAICNYYRRFIRNFADIAKPLTNLLKKNITFIWNDEQQKAFELLKNCLKGPNILQYPNFNVPFILTTDASNYALGAVLSQGEIGKDLPIAYASRSLNKSELNKSVIEKELLAIHWGIKYFKPYLFGEKFVVVTDHRPLVSLFTHKDPSSKMTRIRMDLMDYNFEIIYKPGKYNVNADALSRVIINSDTLKSMVPTNNINIVTRSKSKAEQIIKNKNDVDKINKVPQIVESPGKTDHLFIWNCSSISDIKYKIKLEFHKGTLNKLEHTQKFLTYQFNDKSITNIDSLLMKLSNYAEKSNIDILALGSDDEIFQYTSLKDFKNAFNNIQQDKLKKGKIDINNGLKIILFNKPIRLTDKVQQETIIKEYHDSKIGAHTGVKRTINKIKQRFIWKNMSKMVKTYVNNCEKCSKNKTVRHIKEPMVLTDTPKNSFEVISMDTIGPLYPSNEFRYILSIQCDLTKYVETFPLQSKSALSIARCIVNNIILKYGNIKIFKSDKGSEYVNELLKNICEILEIKQITSTAYHHETMGGIERTHRVLNEYIRSFANKDNWHEYLPYFTFAYNVTPHSDTLYSPYELVFGKIANLPSSIKIDSIDKINKSYDYDDFASELKTRLQYSHLKAKEFLELAKCNRKLLTDKKSYSNDFQTGDLVFLNQPANRKLCNKYEGPYKIKRREGVNSVLEINKNKEVTVHNNRLKPFKIKLG